MSLHFLIGRHPLDLLQSALTLPGDPLIVLTAAGPACAHLLSQSLAADYPGLLALLGWSQQPVIRQVSIQQRQARIVFPPAPGLAPNGLSELLDRLRTRHPDALVLVDLSRLAVDLPPLADNDEVTCLWELRDPLDGAALGAFAALQARLEIQPARFHGLKLYSRDAQAAQSASGRAAEIQQACGLCAQEPLLVLS